MTRTLTSLLLSLWIVGPGIAAAQSATPDPAALAARELLSMTLDPETLQQMIEPVIGMVVEASRPQLQQALSGPPTDAELAAFAGAVERAFTGVFTAAAFAEALAPIVASSLSADEINELIAILRTPLGQKLLLFQRQSAERGAAAGMELAERKKVELTEALDRELRAAFPGLKPGR